MTCKECNAEISGNICQNCGYKNISKNKRIVIISIIAVVAIALIITLSFAFTKTNENKNIKLCVAEAQAFSEMITKSKSNFNIIGTLYSSSTKTNHGYSWDEEYFTNYVTGLCLSEISKEKTSMQDIKIQYESIKDIEYSNDKIKEIKKQTENLYNAYEDMYDLLIEQNFTYKNYESKYTQAKNDFDMALELYNNTLEEMNTNN